MASLSSSCCWWLLALVAVAAGGSLAGNVTYDGRALVIDGKRMFLFSGAIHYPRSTPDMWPALIARGKAGGLDVIETYTFWNLHEPQEGQYDFSGNKDLVQFIKEIQKQGLYAVLRIGPFIESEWNYGGLPYWLHNVPGIVFRSDNEPWKNYMQKFTTKIVTMLKDENLFASQGGPIIASQIENEYQNVEEAFHERGPPYVIWAAQMAVAQNIGVPWLMCKQDDAPDPIINTCNGMRCGQTFVGPNKPYKPSLWTESWTAFYQVYGEDSKIKTAEDLAYNVALFIANKTGSFINYYMYHGGTNFGRTASAFVPTSYYDSAPLDEYGLPTQPKWGHLKELHTTIKQLCSDALLSAVPTTSSLGDNQQAIVFEVNPTNCVAFFVNRDSYKDVTVTFRNSKYDLPPKSISILPDCKTIAFNTAKVTAQTSERSRIPVFKFDSADKWNQFLEVVPSFEDAKLRANALLDHANTTNDATDYLWYTFSFQLSSAGQQELYIDSLGHVVRAYVNGVPAGSAYGSKKTNAILKQQVYLNAGVNKVSILSVMSGLPDNGAFLERRLYGLREVSIGQQSFTAYSWGYQVGMLGEYQQIYTQAGSTKVQWSKFNPKTQPLTWYKSFFDAPGGTDPIALDLGSMGKGEVWVNGQSIGRYWVSYKSPSGAVMQTWYHVPRSFLKPTGNLLVLLEEEYGNPLYISVGTVTTQRVCAHTSDSHPPPVISWKGKGQIIKENEIHHGRRPKVQLHCPPTKNISGITFASFGNPSGNCQSCSVGSCHSPNSRAVVEKACLGKNRCSVPKSSTLFGGDPCPGLSKGLLVEAECR